MCIFLNGILNLFAKRGLENEKKLNDNYMKKKHGQKVNFGDIIQVTYLFDGFQDCPVLIP